MGTPQSLLPAPADLPLFAAQLSRRPRQVGHEAGDWLTLGGLLGQSLNIGVLPGKITIRAEVGLCRPNKTSR
ncbi:hypothetical protein [Pectobacterium carotovorum]|uniref:hypothetical protein n=1 Tax=Pectobacterium carotovorum TaxID=554 RepID=UPI001EFC2C28|nr:hypothetical protein [Pectobacterium carotovorum]